MKSLFQIFFVVLFLNSLFGQIKIDTIIWEGKEIEIAEGEFGFKLKSETYKTHLNNMLIKNTDVVLKKDIDKNNIGLLKINTKTDINERIKELNESGIFIKIFPNTIRRGCSVNPNDTYVPNQYAITNMDLREAWEITKGSSNIILSISDSGIPMQNGNLSHGDLNNSSRYILGLDAIEDGNSVKDENGHGTHVLGIAAATSNNNTGVAGVNWNSPVYICQSLDYKQDGFASDFYETVVDAVDHGAKVINYSSGGRSQSEYDTYAIEYAQNNNVLIVASAGNETDHKVLYPAKLANQYNNLIAVSALTEEDRFYAISSHGSEVTVSAPGKYIVSTTPNYSFYEPWQLNYAYASGTSMSAPYVAGVASLVFSIHPNYTPSQVKQILIESADDIQYYDSGFPIWPFDDWEVDVGRDDYTGYGRVNAFKAVSGLRYKLTLNNSPTGKNGLSVGDYVKIWDLAVNYVGKVTISDNMIAPDGYWRWNGLVDDGKYNLADGMYIGKKNGSGSSFKIILQGDNTLPTASGFSFVNNSRFKVSINEYFNVVWVTAFVFDANGNFVRKDFENRISNAGNNKYFNLNSPLSNGQILKAFLVDNAGHVNSISKQYTQIPLTVNISGPTYLTEDETGTFTANPSGGSGTYTNYQWWYRNDEGTTPPKSITGGISPMLPPSGYWIDLSYYDGEQTIIFGPVFNFSLKFKVTDSNGDTAEDLHSVIVGGLAKDIAKPTPIAALEAIPDQLTLSDNYPNPFNPITTIRFGLPESQKVELSIYDLGGSEVKTLLRDVTSAGYHQVQWDGKDNSGNKVPSGIYIYQMSSDNISLVKKRILTK